jgi:hypothetical protein
MRRLRQFMFLILVLSFTMTLYAQSVLEATSETDKTKANLGDVIRYTLTVKRQGDMSQPPTIALPSFAGFRVAGSYTNSMMNFINGAASAQNQQIIDLIAVKSGEITIEPAKVKFLNAATKLYETIETKPVVIYIGQGKRKTAALASTVVPTATLTEPDIRSIKYNYSFDLSGLLPYIILALLFLAALYYAWRRIFGKKKEIAAVPYTEDFRKTALRRIKKAKDFLKSNDSKSYYSELYEAVREFLNSHMNNTFNELTTQEILKKLEELKTAQKDKDMCLEFMKECDLVKFADYKPSDTEAEDAGSKAENLINNFS